MMFHCGPHFCRAWCVVADLVSHTTTASPDVIISATQSLFVRRCETMYKLTTSCYYFAGWRCVNIRREAGVRPMGVAAVVL